MKGERLNSEKKINSNNFKLKIGTINKKSPLVIYIDGNTFITPTLDKENYDDDILNIKKNFIFNCLIFIFNSKSIKIILLSSKISKKKKKKVKSFFLYI